MNREATPHPTRQHPTTPKVDANVNTKLGAKFDANVVVDLDAGGAAVTDASTLCGAALCACELTTTGEVMI